MADNGVIEAQSLRDSLYRPVFLKSWLEASLYELALWTNGMAFRNIDFTSIGRPVIKIAEIKNGISGQTKFTNAEYESCYFVTAGEMLFSWSGQPETSIDVFWWRGQEGWLNQHIFKVKPVEHLDPVFFFYMLRYLKPNFIRIARNKQTTGLGHVTIADLKRMTVGVPPLPEQRAIATILGVLDDKIELNHQMNQTLETMAQALFKSWFVDFEPFHGQGMQDSPLGPIPVGWKIKVLDDLTNFVLGGDWGKDDLQEDTTEPAYCIRGADIPDLQHAGVGKMPIRYLKPSSLGKRSLCVGDIVIEISGGSPTQSTGRAVLVTTELLSRLDHPLVCSNFCRLIRLRPGISPNFVYFWLRRLYEADDFLKYETGTTGIKNFAYTTFSNTHFLVLPPAEVLNSFDKQGQPLLTRHAHNGMESESLATIRDTLLPKLLSGEIRVKDAEKLVEETV